MYNPSTKGFRRLLVCRIWVGSKKFNLACLGYDSSTEDYKVVPIVKRPGPGWSDYAIMVYSLKLDS